jgi:hypothetical protein
MSVAAAIAAAGTHEGKIDPALALEAEVKSGRTPGILSLRDRMRGSRITIFTAAVFLLHLANTATFPLVGRMLCGERDEYLRCCPGPVEQFGHGLRRRLLRHSKFALLLSPFIAIGLPLTTLLVALVHHVGTSH